MFKTKNLLNNIWKIMYFVSFVLAGISFVYGVTGHNYRSIIVLTVVFILSFMAFCAFFMFDRKNVEIIYQLWPIYGFFCLFYNSSFLSDCVEKRYLINNIIGILVLNIPFFFITVWCACDKWKIRNIKKTLQSKWEIFLVSIIFAILSFDTLSTMTRLDSNIYYTYLNEAKYWNLSFDTIINFKLGGHQSIGYTLWGLIGVYLTPDSPLGVRVINVLLVISSIFCLSAIYQKIMPIHSRIICVLAVAAFAFNPLILGIIYEINLDLPSECFYIWVLYALLYDKKLLFLCSSLLLVFSKETGILLLFGVAVGWGVSWVITFITKYKTVSLKKMIKKIPMKMCALFMVAPVLMLISMKFTSIWRQESLNVQNQSGQGMDTFGINLENTIIKLKEIFLINFSWIGTLIIVGCLIVIIIKKKKRYMIMKKSLIQGLPLYISCLFFMIFQFIYITYCHIRYIIPVLPGMISIMIVLLYSVMPKKKIVYLMMGYLTVILAQNFYTLDPVSKMVCHTIDIGTTKIISTRTFVRSTENTIQTEKSNPKLIQELQLTQSAIYNRQYMQFLDAFEKMLDDINYDDSTFVAVAPIYENEVERMTWISLFGRWYSDELFYDAKKKHLTDDVTKQRINVAVINSQDDINYQEYDRVYLISFPYNNHFDEKSFLNKFSYIDSFVVQKKFWEIDVYRLK